MPLRLGLLALAFAAAACQPHLVPAETAEPLPAGEETVFEGLANDDGDLSSSSFVEDPGEEADASPSGRRDETPDRIERLGSRTRLLGGARGALRERRRR